MTERATFTTSRTLDFFSEKELTAQIGHGTGQWPLVVLKELVDNSLDACEEAGAAPAVSVTVDGEGITVADNGPGIPPGTIAGVLDYSVRVSSREAYAAPDRGAQGNALKTLVAMPYVLDGTEGRLTVSAREVRHEITVGVDPIRQEPVVSHTTHPSDVRTGTRITVHWPGSASSILDDTKDRFLQTAADYTWLNPHLALDLTWHGERHTWSATSPEWSKWKPSEPTSPHWYTPELLERLVAAHLNHPGHESMTVREFITQFRGLSGSVKGKQVLAEAAMARMPLSGLANGKLDSEAIARLLEAMRGNSRPVKPPQLGVIGRDHMETRFAELDAEMDSVTYKRLTGTTDDLPWVVEMAFGWCPDLGDRRLVTGVNWSPGLGNPFKQMGKEGRSLDTLLARQYVDEDCVVVIHLATPRVTWTDRGKAGLVIS